MAGVVADNGFMILGADHPEFEILGNVRKLQIGGEPFEAFEFVADVTDYRPALALSDSWDAAVLDRFPKSSREMADAELLALFEPEDQHGFLRLVNRV